MFVPSQDAQIWSSRDYGRSSKCSDAIGTRTDYAGFHTNRNPALITGFQSSKAIADEISKISGDCVNRAGVFLC